MPHKQHNAWPHPRDTTRTAATILWISDQQFERLVELTRQHQRNGMTRDRAAQLALRAVFGLSRRVR
jgi:hypothetical protein